VDKCRIGVGVECVWLAWRVWAAGRFAMFESYAEACCLWTWVWTGRPGWTWVAGALEWAAAKFAMLLNYADDCLGYCACCLLFVRCSWCGSKGTGVSFDLVMVCCFSTFMLTTSASHVQLA
jgi:hypothetical protein